MRNLDSVPAHIKGIFIRELGETIMIISEKGDMLHTLDQVGSFIWKNMDGKSNLNAILDKICAEYDIDRPQAEKDLMKFMDELITIGLVTI